MTFILQDIVVCVITTFTIGLYVGAFVQHRRDLKIFKSTAKVLETYVRNCMKKEEK